MFEQIRPVVKPYLKWVGGKTRVLDIMRKNLGKGDILIEPFVGAGSVFLGTDFDYYICADYNADLINCHLRVQQDVEAFIKGVKIYFGKKHLNERAYIRNRTLFNETNDLIEKAVLFTYLNKHGYNGLCRYNKTGGYNVSWGKKLKLVDPEIEMIRAFHEKSQRVLFIHQHYSKTFRHAQKGAVIYCDPPYLPTDDKPSFTSYTKKGFPYEDQQALAVLAQEYSSICPVLISNHNTAVSQKLYRNATKTVNLEVTRTVACNANARGKAKEILAVYGEPSDEKLINFSPYFSNNRVFTD